MKTVFRLILLLVFSSLSLMSIADIPVNSVYIDGGDSNKALILCHGKGKYPRWLVVEPLRKGVQAKLGYHTLSLQMPNENKNWKKYAADFPDAYSVIKQAIRYLQNEKAVTRIYLMGHSMGSRMTSSFVSDNPEQPIKGLIVAGCRNNGGYPLACKQSLENVDIPILDVWGGANNKDNQAASEREEMLSEVFQQQKISGANHKFEGYESQFVAVVVTWLKKQK